MKKIIATVLGSFVIISSLIGQDYIIKNYSVSEGLKGTMVYCFYQDSLGFIWMGTNEGLSRFDGSKFVNYDKPEQLSEQKIKSIQQNINGELLLLTDNGKTWKFDNANFTKYSFNSKLIVNKKITALCFNKNKLFIGTSNGAFLKKGNILKPIPKIKGKIISIETDANENLYIINQADGVFEYMNDSIQLLFPHDNNPHKNILKHKKGDYWSNQSPNGVFQNKEGKWLHIFGDNDLTIYDLKEDHDETIWVSTYIGLYRIIDNYYSEIYVLPEIENETTSRIFVDRDNNLWVSTFGNGVYKLSQNPFVNFKFPSTFPDEWAEIILKDNKGGIWIEAGDHGLMRYYDDRFYEYQLYKKLGKRNISCAVDLDSVILFGGENILLEFKNEQFKEIKSTGLPDNFEICEIAKSNKEVFAIIDFNSIYRFDGVKWEKANYFTSSQLIYHLCVDSKNNLWIGTKRGLYRIENDKAIPFLSTQLSDKTEIRSISNSTDSSIWLASDIGIFQIKNDSVESFLNKEKGLVSNDAMAVRAIGDTVFIGTRGGLSLYSNSNFTNFTISDGLISNFIFPPKIEMINGKLFMGGGNGYSILLLNRLKDKETNLGVFLSSIKSNSDTLIFNPLQIEQADIVELEPGNSSIIFSFNIIDFNSHKSTNFRYKVINGKSDDWIYITNPDIQLLNYNPGKYELVFEIKNQNNVWEQVYTQKFTITKYWLQTNYALFVYFLLLIALITLLIYRKKNRQNRKYSTSSLSSDKYKDAKIKLGKLFDEEKVYRQPEISLTELAKKLDIPKEHISQVLNSEYNLNFNALVNKYRIEEAKYLLVYEFDKYKSIIQVAYEVGFNSKSSFNNAFKKYTNNTPTEYRRSFSTN